MTVVVLTLMIKNTRQRERTERFLNEHLGIDLTGLQCIFVSSGAQLVAAALGIIGSLTHQSSVLSSVCPKGFLNDSAEKKLNQFCIIMCTVLQYRSLLVCSLTLKVFAFIWAGSLHPLPKLEKYANLFKMEALYLKYEANTSKIWKQPKLFWKIMQSEV